MSKSELKYFIIGEKDLNQQIYVRPEKDFKRLPLLEQVDILVRIEKEVIKIRLNMMDTLFTNTKYPS